MSNSCPSNGIASVPLLLYYSQLELDHKEAEARESAEVAAMYSGKLSKMEKKMKDEMNKEDESYIEITYSLLENNHKLNMNFISDFHFPS